MAVDLSRLRSNVEQAQTEDLLNRITVFRSGMTPAAIELIEAELRKRGITAAMQVDHETRLRDHLVCDEQGLPYRCEKCDNPAVWRGWTWHSLFGRIPLFRRITALCEKHRPTK